MIDSSQTGTFTEHRAGNNSSLEMKTSSSNIYNCNGYITPADPRTYAESSLHDSNPDIPSNHVGGNLNRFNARDKPFLRLDSGLGDSDSLQGSESVKYNRSLPVSSITSLPSPHLPIHYEQPYEDIDQYNRTDHHPSCHQQYHRNCSDVLAVGRSQTVLNSFRPLPQLNISGVTSGDSQDCEHVFSTHIQDSISRNEQDTLHTYMQLNASKHLGTSQKSTRTTQTRCQVIIILVIILLISLAALILSITNLVFNSTQASSDFRQALTNLQQKINDLIKENEVLRMQHKNLTSFVEYRALEVSAHLQNVSYKLDFTNAKFDAVIANISLIPGPRGPPGIANFSLCINQSLTRSAPASATESTETSYLPSANDIQKYFVTFAYCTYNGATNAYLETQLNNTSRRQRYRCKCWGTVSGMTQTLCTLYIWMCPQES